MFKLKASDYIFSSAFFHLKKKNLLWARPFFFFFLFAQKLSQKKIKQADWLAHSTISTSASKSKYFEYKKGAFFCNLQNSFFSFDFPSSRLFKK